MATASRGRWEGDGDVQAAAVARFGPDVTAVGAGHCPHDRKSQARTLRGGGEPLGAEAAEGLEQARELGDGAIDAFLARGGGGDPALLPSGSLQSYGGAVAAVGDAETAFGHRDALMEFVAVAGWTDPAEDQPRMAAARRYAGAVEPFASGVYVNESSMSLRGRPCWAENRAGCPPTSRHPGAGQGRQ